MERDYVEDNAGVTLSLVRYGATLQKEWAEGVIEKLELKASPEEVIKIAHIVYLDMMQLTLAMMVETSSKSFWQDIKDFLQRTFSR